jgi:hypothetical protein
MSTNLDTYLSCGSSYAQNELFEEQPEYDLQNTSGGPSAGTEDATSSHVMWGMDARPAGPSSPADWQAEAEDPGLTGLRVGNCSSLTFWISGFEPCYILGQRKNIHQPCSSLADF